MKNFDLKMVRNEEIIARIVPYCLGKDKYNLGLMMYDLIALVKTSPAPITKEEFIEELSRRWDDVVVGKNAVQ